MQGTVVLSRINLKKLLTFLNVNNDSIEFMLSNLDKMHKHVNAVAFAGMLEKIGLKQEDIGNIFRRIGIDDTTINQIFNILDEEKIQNAFGKIAELKIV